VLKVAATANITTWDPVASFSTEALYLGNFYEQLLRINPTGSQDKLKRTWDDLPPPVQKELQGSLARLPGDLKLWRMLINLAFTQYKIAFGEKQSVAIVGPANVGKSTLYNQLIHSKADRAEVSPVPGTTRVNREADAGLFAIVDTPGADAVGAVGETEKEHALAAAERADLLLVVFDASHVPMVPIP